MVDAGDYVFACCVLVANVKLFVASYQIGAGLIITVFGSVASYLVCASIVSGTKMFIL